jgi:hypothetical protein
MLSSMKSLNLISIEKQTISNELLLNGEILQQFVAASIGRHDVERK